MKFTPIQGDFSAGELSPRLWGQVASDGYKAGLALAANVLSTQQGSFASRAGAKLISDGNIAPKASGTGTVMLPLQDSPIGDVQLEVEAGGTVRFKNRWGVIPWKWNQDLTSFFENNKNGGDVWTDPVERKLYMQNWDTAPGTPQRTLSLECDTAALGTTVGGRTATLAFYWAGGYSSVTAGDVSIMVEQWNGGVKVGTLYGPAAQPGWASISFQPLLGTTLKFKLATFADIGVVVDYGQAAFEIWGLRLCGNWDGGEALALTVTGLVGSLGLRHAAFWADSGVINNQTFKTYHVVFGGPGMTIAGLQWSDPTVAYGWTTYTPLFEGIWPNPTDNTKLVTSPPWLTTGCIGALTAYQGRLWMGLTDKYGSIHATKVGYGTFYLVVAPRYTFTPGETSFQLSALNDAALVAANQYFFNKTYTASDIIRVFKDSGVEDLPAAFTVHPNADQVRSPGGYVSINVPDGVVRRVSHYQIPPTAADSIDVSLAQPSGKIAWFAELRGLILGTGRGELVFSSGALAIDPVSGSAFDIEKHGSYGSDVAVPPVSMGEKVAFVMPGRKRVRVMGKSFNTFGGLLASDLSLVGEHLLAKRVRTMTFLRAPVPRLVFGFDDGTGAVATFNDDKNTLAWARFSLPSGYDIYHVSSMDTGEGSELWVTSSNGESFVLTRLESEAQPRVRKVVPFAAPTQSLPPDNIQQFDDGLPPVMDGWLRRPAHSVADTYTNLPLAWVGHNVVVINHDGTVKGTYAVIFDGGTGGKLDLAEGVVATFLGTNIYTDKNGRLQARSYLVGLLYGDHRAKLLPREGGNPSGTAQGHMSRQPQRWLRLVDSYLPTIKGSRPPERDAAGDVMDWQANRVTGDVRYTEEGSSRAAQTEIVMELPFRMEVAAIFGGTSVASL
jgi:hypothetical protein